MDHQVHLAPSAAGNMAGHLVPVLVVAGASVGPGADHSGDCPAERSATVRDFPSAADRDSQLAADAALVRSDAQRADQDVLRPRRELPPLDALQKVLQIDLPPVGAKVACQTGHSVESVGPVQASDEPTGSQVQVSQVQPVPQASRQAPELQPVAARAWRVLPQQEVVVPGLVRRPEEPERQPVALAQPLPVPQQWVLEPEERAWRPAALLDSAPQALLPEPKQGACALLSPQLPWLPFPLALLVPPQLLLPPGPGASCELFPRRPPESSSSGSSFP